MNTNSQSLNDKHTSIVWYKVPILWLMFALLGFTVISGIGMFIMAHDTKDAVVTESGHTPLSKKLALPEHNNSNKESN